MTTDFDIDPERPGLRDARASYQDPTIILQVYVTLEPGQNFWLKPGPEPGSRVGQNLRPDPEPYLSPGFSGIRIYGHQRPNKQKQVCLGSVEIVSEEKIAQVLSLGTGWGEEVVDGYTGLCELG
ncbi:hypothetical protein B0H11DRAFT_1905957 [Mycena galericulata]|nr:hypothetical protein B0H11DRAFT_1905957 [Mycena galericulata]